MPYSTLVNFGKEFSSVIEEIMLEGNNNKIEIEYIGDNKNLFKFVIAASHSKKTTLITIQREGFMFNLYDMKEREAIPVIDDLILKKMAIFADDIYDKARTGKL